MGYTHYYSGKVTLTGQDVTDIRKIIKAATDQGIGIKGWDGRGLPKISTSEIRLNGDAVYDLDHETFVIKPEGDWSFCKTARKPYDTVVTAILLLLAARNPDTFEFSSDGTREEWSDGEALYTAVIGRPPVIVL